MTIKVDIVSEYKNKGAKEATKSLSGIENTAVKLGKTLAKTFAAYQLLRFSKNAAMAFAENERSAASLATTMRNLGAELTIPSAEIAIQRLSDLATVGKDEIRPAFAQVFRILGSVTDATKVLETATNVAKGTGADLGSVVTAITKAYAGNYKGLIALETGLTKAEIASGDMELIMGKLNKTFSGQNAAYLDTYAGKTKALSESVGNAMEIIGAGIFDALAVLAGSNDIDKISEKVTKFATNIATMVTTVAKLMKMTFDSVIKPILDALGKTYDLLQKIGVIAKDKITVSTALDYRENNAGRIAAEAKDRQLAAQRLAQEKKLMAEQKKTAAAKLKAERDLQKTKKAGTMFDIEKIQVVAALQGKITADEKLRLELQLALLTGNASEADRLSNELLISQARTTGLATFIANLPKALNPFADYPAYVQAALAELAKLAAGQKSLGVQPSASTEESRYRAMAASLEAQGLSAAMAASSIRMQAQADAYFKSNPNINPMTGAVINVQVEVGGQQLTDIVTNAQINNSASGIQSKLNRLNLID
jgi:hypothetical protein